MYKRKIGYRKKTFRVRNDKYNMENGMVLHRRNVFPKSVLDAEDKFVDITGAGVSITNAGTIIYLSDSGEGDDYTNRNGRSVKAKDLFCRYTIYQGATPTNAVARVIYFIDNANQGALPAVTDVLQAASQLSPLNKNNGKRFTVLYDKIHAVNVNGMEVQTKKYYRRLSHHLKYSTTASGVAGALIGSIFMLIISDQATGADQPLITHYERFKFYDN